MPHTAALRIAVIGAGVSGLVAARILTDRHHAVQVFEKSRGAGGRAATRRAPPYAFDHGAQYFTARDPDFRRWVESWLEAGVVAPWCGRVGVVGEGRVDARSQTPERFVGVPGMSAMCRHLARGLNTVFGTQVAAAHRDDGAWILEDAHGADLGRFDVMLVSAPAPQAVPLLAAAPDLARRAATAQLLPTWTAMVAFSRPLELSVDGAFGRECALAWLARDSSKPGRSGECWVLHATPEWSAQRLEVPGEVVAKALLEIFFEATGLAPRESVFLAAHRWRYAVAARPLEVGYLWDAALGVGACGDWCRVPRIEGAFLSGTALAGQVLELVGAPIR